MEGIIILSGIGFHKHLSRVFSMVQYGFEKAVWYSFASGLSTREWDKSAMSAKGSTVTEDECPNRYRIWRFCIHSVHGR